MKVQIFSRMCNVMVLRRVLTSCCVNSESAFVNNSLFLVSAYLCEQTSTLVYSSLLHVLYLYLGWFIFHHVL